MLFSEAWLSKIKSMVQGVQAIGVDMRVLRLPAIHHDANLVVVDGLAGNLLIDAGTSWYQSLQVERIKGVLGDENRLDRILLTSKRYPCSGGSKHLSEAFTDCIVHIHPEGQAALEIGDFFTTWANRFDSDMPPVGTQWNGLLDPRPKNDGSWHFTPSRGPSNTLGLTWWLFTGCIGKSQACGNFQTKVNHPASRTCNQRRETRQRHTETSY
jgi:hypothetical protein